MAFHHSKIWNFLFPQKCFKRSFVVILKQHFLLLFLPKSKSIHTDNLHPSPDFVKSAFIAVKNNSTAIILLFVETETLDKILRCVGKNLCKSSYLVFRQNGRNFHPNSGVKLRQRNKCFRLRFFFLFKVRGWSEPPAKQTAALNKI